MYVSDAYAKMLSLLQRDGYRGCDLLWMLKRDDDQYTACFLEYGQDDYIISVDVSKDNYAIAEIDEWDFSIDSYLFGPLQEGYQVVKISLNIHEAVWYQVADEAGQMRNVAGFQNYLAFCKEKGISFELLKSGIVEPVEDIMKYYHPKNRDFVQIR